MAYPTATPTVSAPLLNQSILPLQGGPSQVAEQGCGCDATRLATALLAQELTRKQTLAICLPRGPALGHAGQFCLSRCSDLRHASPLHSPKLGHST